MKNLRSKTECLVKQILNEDYLDANKTLKSLILEAEEDREQDVADNLEGDDAELDQETDTTDEEGEFNENEGAEGEGEDEDEINTDVIDEPSDGDPNLGDALEDDISDQAVSEAEMSEMSNDVVEINCEINQKIISKLYDKISNLKTKLNEMDLEKDSREYITLETKLSYYGNKLEELQTKTNPAIDQAKVEERIQIIDSALKTLESEIGGEDVEDVKSTDELDEETAAEEGEGGEESTEGGEEGEGEEGEGEEGEGGEEPAEGEGEEEPTEG